MWVKGTPLHFIVDSGSQKNIISAEVVKQLDFPTTPHPQPYNIGWLRQGQDLHVSQQCRLSYDIKPFKDEVLCDVSPLEVCDVLLGQPYMWRRHVVYESRPRSIIVTLGGQLYRIPEVVPTIVPPKQCHKVISHTAKFSLFTIRSEGEQKDTATTAASTQDLSIQQKQIDKIVDEYQDVLVAPTGVPPHCPVKQGYNRTLHTLHVASSPTESSHTQVDHAARLVERIQLLQQQVHDILQQAKQDNFFSKASNTPSFRFSRSLPISQGNLTQWGPLLPKGGGMIQMDLSGHPPLPLNHHFEPVVLINHDIHPFDGEWNVMSSSFVNYRHHLMIS
jgi:hypothetical protein